MDIVIGGTLSVKKDSSEDNAAPPAGKKEVRKNRRQNERDRRTSVREGIFVCLSAKSDRRVLRDRRKVSF